MRTYEEILNSMKEKYENLTGSVVCEESDIGIRMRILGGEIYSALQNAEWLKRQMFPDTAEGDYLEKHAAMRGLERRGAAPSFGVVTFSLSEALTAPVAIPKGTVVGTQGENAQRFETLEDAVIEVGETAADVQVRALLAGREGNVRRETVNVLVTSPAYIDRVTNKNPFSGGVDPESDESLRERIIDSFINVSNGTNCAYYRNMALKVEGVTSAGVVPKERGAGTVDIYIASENTEATDEQVEMVQDVLSELREVNVDVQVHKATPVHVSIMPSVAVKEGYEFEEVREKCEEALHDYIATRGVGGKVLLIEAGELLYHIEGVKQYSFTSMVNSNVLCKPYQYPVPFEIIVKEGEAL